MLRRIRKAASGKSKTRGWKSSTDTDGRVRYLGRPHAEINVGNIHAICDGDQDAIDHMEEYGRLSTIERLNMFARAVSGKLVKTFEHSEKIGDSSSDIPSGLVAKADALKASVVKPDPFMDRAVVALFADECTWMKIPYEDERGVRRWKARLIGRDETDAIGRGRPRKLTKLAAVITTPPKRGRPRKTDLSDLRVMQIIPPPISDGRDLYLAGSTS